MNDYSKKVLYNCLTYLLDELSSECESNRMSNNFFKKITNKFSKEKNSDDINNNFIYIFITTIILNNRAFFKNHFVKLPWDIPLDIFDIESTINNIPVSDFTQKKLNLDFEETYDDYYDAHVDDTFLVSDINKNDYYSYLTRKYKNSRYNPDVQEIITFEQRKDDYRVNDNEVINDDLIEVSAENYEKAIASLPNRLKNINGANLGMIIQSIRNALAHNQFYFADDGLYVYNRNSETHEINLECHITTRDMTTILAEYIKIITNLQNIEVTPQLLYIYLNNIENISTYREYKSLKKYLKKEFEIFHLENEFMKMVNEVETEINNNQEKYLSQHEHDIFIDLLDVDGDLSDEELKKLDEEKLDCNRMELLLKEIKNWLMKNNNKMFTGCKILEIYATLEAFNNIIKGYPSDDESLYYPIEMITKKYPFLHFFNISYENKYILANISVLLNILFVQCSYDAVDKSLIDLSSMQINNDYIEEKKEVFEPQMKKNKEAYEELLEKVNNFDIAINTGKVGSDRKKYLAIMKEKLDYLKNSSLRLKSKFNSSIHFDSISILTHIRNSMAHGSYIIENPQKYMNLKDLKIIIRDYEPETDKLTFSGTISIYNLLTNLLKPEIVEQLFNYKSNNKKRR